MQVWNVDTPDTFIEIIETIADVVNQAITFELEESLVEGQHYVIRISYVAQIADSSVRMNGLYRSSYTNEDGAKR